jgi:hypothetical protein
MGTDRGSKHSGERHYEARDMLALLSQNTGESQLRTDNLWRKRGELQYVPFPWMALVEWYRGMVARLGEVDLYTFGA